jgi:dTDP-4-amino-4,6-dideoxygalactose transaminase
MTKQQSVPMNDLKRMYLRHQIQVEQEVIGTLRTGWWLNGQMGKTFAANFARYVGVENCVLVANGTDALELALAAALELRRPEGREVVLVANAGGYGSCACWHNGLVPHFVDIEPASQLMSIPAALAAVGENTAAIIVTHLYGGAVDVRALRDGLAKLGLSHIPIIEDCAQSHGARIKGEMTGSLGDVATFSFYPTKNLGAMGDGGAVVTADAAIAGHIRQLQQYGWTSKYHVGVPNGRNSRMDEVQAALLDVLLPHLEERNRLRRDILSEYRSAGQRRVRFVQHGEGDVAHLAVAVCDDRDAFRAFMTERGIDTDIHYPVLDCDQAGWAGLPMMGQQTLAVSRASVGRVCSVPCYPDMTADEVARVRSAITDWESL